MDPNESTGSNSANRTGLIDPRRSQLQLDQSRQPKTREEIAQEWSNYGTKLEAYKQLVKNEPDHIKDGNNWYKWREECKKQHTALTTEYNRIKALPVKTQTGSEQIGGRNGGSGGTTRTTTTRTVRRSATGEYVPSNAKNSQRSYCITGESGERRPRSFGEALNDPNYSGPFSVNIRFGKNDTNIKHTPRGGMWKRS